MLLQQKNSGFTLIETSIVLFIFCLIFTIPALKLENFKEELELKNTSRLISSVIDTTTRRALLNKKVYNISYFKNSKQIHISQGNDIQTIKVSSKVNIEHLDNIFVSNKGSIAPKTIVIRSKNKQKIIKVQMKWGRMIYG